MAGVPTTTRSHLLFLLCTTLSAVFRFFSHSEFLVFFSYRDVNKGLNGSRCGPILWCYFFHHWTSRNVRIQAVQGTENRLQTVLQWRSWLLQVVGVHSTDVFGLLNLINSSSTVKLFLFFFFQSKVLKLLECRKLHGDLGTSESITVVPNRSQMHVSLVTSRE